MAKISFNMDSEEAIYAILGCISLINDKKTTECENLYSDWGFDIIESTLAAAAKALDIEHFNGTLTKEMAWVEGSAE